MAVGVLQGGLAPFFADAQVLKSELESNPDAFTRATRQADIEIGVVGRFARDFERLRSLLPEPTTTGSVTEELPREMLSIEALRRMRGVEQAGKNSGRIDWIDFRLLRANDVDIAAKHFHISARGAYPPGTFASQLVRRAEHHGTRILGTLKSGSDVNVLAIYER